MPKREPPPDGPGVAAVFPNKLPPPPPGFCPKSPPELACPEVEASSGLFGVWEPPPNKGEDPDWFCALPPPNDGLCPGAGPVPNSEGEEVPLVDAPTFPKRLPPEAVFEEGWLEEPKRLPLEPPDEAGLPNEKAMVDET